MGGEFSKQVGDCQDPIGVCRSSCQVTWLEKKSGEFCQMGGEFSGQVGDCEDPLVFAEVLTK